MKVLIACEESGTVRNAFRKKGHDAYSCDILPNDSKYHIQDDVFNVLYEKWDMMIAHPPCTYLSNAGIRWFNEEKFGDKAVKRKLQRLNAMEFVNKLYESGIPKICIENPVGYLNNHWKKPDQVIQPYFFGDTESKRTCLWLKNLPILIHTNIVKPKIHSYLKSGKNKGKPIYFTESIGVSTDRGKLRSKTFQGIAEAMANQWGGKND